MSHKKLARVKDPRRESYFDLESSNDVVSGGDPYQKERDKNQNHKKNVSEKNGRGSSKGKQPSSSTSPSSSNASNDSHASATQPETRTSQRSSSSSTSKAEVETAIRKVDGFVFKSKNTSKKTIRDEERENENRKKQKQQHDTPSANNKKLGNNSTSSVVEQQPRDDDITHPLYSSRHINLHTLPPYSIPIDSIYDSQLSTEHPTPISDALPSICQREIQSLTQLLNHNLTNDASTNNDPLTTSIQHTWLVPHLQEIMKNTLERYNHELHQRYIQYEKESLREKAMEQLNSLVTSNSSDLQVWMNDLHAYGQNTTQLQKYMQQQQYVNAGDGVAKQLITPEITQLNTVYQTFAIKGDTILSKLRNIHTVVQNSTNYTLQLMKSINQHQNQLYGISEKKDSKELIKNLLHTSIKHNYSQVAAKG